MVNTLNTVRVSQKTNQASTTELLVGYIDHRLSATEKINMPQFRNKNISELPKEYRTLSVIEFLHRVFCIDYAVVGHTVTVSL